MAIVISPLISLMNDQVMKLSELGIKACLLGTAQKDANVYEVMGSVYNLNL
jgi:superfamily II DNA helicase RecQ